MEGVDRLVAAALAEDVGAGDLTTEATVPAELEAKARIVQKQPGCVFGFEAAAAAFSAAGAGRLEALVEQGRWGDAVPVEVATVQGPARALLTAERTALNLLTHLSGVATLTGRWVEAIAGTGARVRDSRKTLPGLRSLEKYAVRCGGGVNHRMSLSDAALIKDNHVVAAGGVAEAFRAVRERYPDLPIEVEIDRLDQLEAVLDEGAEEILLDNFTIEDTSQAVQVVKNRAKNRVALEASGGLTLESARDVAETGVDYLAVGALTHSAPALDIALDLRG